MAIDFPPPSWIQDGAAFLLEPSADAEVDVRQTVMYLPSGENFRNWSRAFVLLALDFRGQTIQGIPDNHLNVAASHIGESTRRCGQDQTFSKELSRTDREINFILFCEAGREPESNVGYDIDHGVIGIYSVFAYLGRVVSVSQEWRGTAFHVRDRGSWPVPAGELELMQARLATIRVLGSTRPK